MVTFDDVCHAYLLRTEGLDPHCSLDDSRRARDVRDEFCRRWPRHAAGLRDFVETQWLLETGPDVAPDPAEESRLVARGRELANNLLAARCATRQCGKSWEL